MRLLIKNKYGEFEMGGGNHSVARIINIVGLGLPTKEPETITFSGQPGHMTKNVRDMGRTITISFDFYGGQKEIEKLYKILYYPVELLFSFGDKKRKITGRCINPEDIEKIIYQQFYKGVIQFVCDNPYFNDFYNTKIAVFNRADQFPNVSEDGNWYVELPAAATVRTITANILNSGEIEVYPIIHIYNSASQIALMSEFSGIMITNESTGAKIELDYSPADGEEITIDLALRRITSNISGSIIDYITDDTDLSKFILQLGDNKITCENLTGSGNLSAVVEYTNNYAMAVMK